jgi:hypothetical protein
MGGGLLRESGRLEEIECGVCVGGGGSSYNATRMGVGVCIKGE